MLDILEFLQGILAVAGIEDEPTFDRSYIINKQEEVQVLTMAAQFLTEDYITTKILTVLGDGDRAEEMVAEMDAEGVERLSGIEEG